MSVKVYRYGLLPPTNNAALVADQMRLHHRYSNKLTEIERDRRESVRKVMEAHGDIPEMQARAAELAADLKDAILVIKAQRAVTRDRSDTAAMRARVTTLRKELKARRATIKSAKKASKEDPVVNAAITDADTTAKAAVRKARAESGLYWGTYLQAEDAARQASRERRDPKFKRWDGSGKIAVQLQKGLPTDDLFKSDRRARVAPVAPSAWDSPSRGERRRTSRTVLKVRVGSRGRDPIWAEWPMIMHRPLPPEGRIKWIYVMRTREGWREKWRCCVVVDDPEIVENTGAGTIAVHIGWRSLGPGRLRVAYWSDSFGDSGCVELDPSVMSGIGKTESLRSIRDRSLDTMRPRLAAWLKDHKDDIPEWLAERTTHLCQWRSPARFAALARAWRDQPWRGGAEGYKILEDWRYRDQHLLDWEAAQRRKSRNRKEEQYRVLAANWAKSYACVVVDNIDLSKLARKKEVESEDGDIPAARYHRFVASVSSLRGAVKNACRTHNAEFFVEDAANITRECHHCRSIELFDHAHELSHTCGKCGETWDQDHNAARNLLREHAGDEVDPGSARDNKIMALG